MLEKIKKTKVADALKYIPFEDLYPNLKEVKIMRDGDSFGELALLGGKAKKRAATILCKEDTHFAVLDRDNFTNILSIF